MTDSESEVEKIVGRFSELRKRPFMKIPQQVIKLEKIINALDEEIREEETLQNPDIERIQLLKSRKIQRLKDLNIAKTKIKRG